MQLVILEQIFILEIAKYRRSEIIPVNLGTARGEIL
jgi:hypothetical protein